VLPLYVKDNLLMIRIENISQAYHAGTPNEVLALDWINLKVQPGEFVVLVGANGSGKSTLLNTIAGSIPITVGNIWLESTDVTDLKDFERSKWISRIFQNPLLGTASDLSVIDNFRLAALRTHKKGLSTGIDHQFRYTVQEEIAFLGMGLENKLDQPMGSLSGGQRQALTLVMAIMDDAKILLMDEPTAALDPKSAEIVMKAADHIIKTYNLTAILVTHNMKDAHQYGTRIIHMQEGKVVHDIDSTEKQKLQLVDLYNWFA
jgi:putative ABC transport system ATP-binding protein